MELENKKLLAQVIAMDAPAESRIGLISSLL
jgi:hypothetical protein